MGENTLSLPKYKCHKEVQALKIKQFDYNSKFDKVIIEFENSNYSNIEVDFNYMNKHKPNVGGYYIVYKDGYQSYSPADVFEEGYTLIK